jgi:tetratricopeptide (TPR) repeat protein
VNLSAINFKGTNYYRPEDLKFKLNPDIQDALMREMEDERSPFYVWFNNYLDSELTTPFSLFLRGYSYEYRGMYIESLDFYNRALNIKPHPIILLHKARTFYKSDLKDSVLNILNEALKIKPNGELYYEKGKILYEHEKDYNGALECFNNSLKYNKKDINALKGKSDTLYKLDNHEEGKKHLDILNKTIQEENDAKLSALVKGKKVDVEVLDKDMYRIAKKPDSDYLYITMYSGNTVVLGIKSFLKPEEDSNEIFSNVIGEIYELNKEYNPEENPFIKFEIINPAVFYWNEYDGLGHLLEKGKAEIIDERYNRKRLKAKKVSSTKKEELDTKPKVKVNPSIGKVNTDKKGLKVLKILLIIFIPIILLSTIILFATPSLFNNSQNDVDNSYDNPGEDPFTTEDEETIPTDIEQSDSDDLEETIPTDIEQSDSDDLEETIPTDNEQSDSDDLEETIPTDNEQSDSDDLEETIPTDIEQSDSDDLEETIPTDNEQSDSDDLEETIPTDIEQSDSDDLEETIPLDGGETGEDLLPTDSEDSDNEENKIAELNKEISSLKGDIQIINEQYKNLEKEKKDLEERLNNAKKENPKNVDDLKSQISNLENDLINNLKKIEELEKEKKDLEERLGNVNNNSKLYVGNLNKLRDLNYPDDKIPYYKLLKLKPGEILTMTPFSNKYYIHEYDIRISKEYLSMKVLKDVFILSGSARDANSNILEISRSNYEDLKIVTKFLLGKDIDSFKVYLKSEDGKKEIGVKLSVEENIENDVIKVPTNLRKYAFGDGFIKERNYAEKMVNRRLGIAFDEENNKLYFQKLDNIRNREKYIIPKHPLTLLKKEGELDRDNTEAKILNNPDNILLNYIEIEYKDEYYYVPMNKLIKEGDDFVMVIANEKS